MQASLDRKLKILLCGYGHLGLGILQGLLSCHDQCEVVGVFRWTARPGGHAFWEPVEDDFKNLIAQAGLLDIQCTGVNSFEFIQLLQELQPDVVLVGSWGEILKPHILELPGVILVNCHPSKLPAHRGANPYASVILQQETETGVTFHRMAPQIDAGAIFLQRSVPLGPYENGETVRGKCVETAQAMVPELVSNLYRHVVHGEPLPELEQDHTVKSYYGQLKQERGQLDWSQNAEDMFRQIRGLYPWIVCYSFLEGRRAVVFYECRFIAVDPAVVQGKLPGTIHQFEQGAFQVVVNDPNFLLEVTTYQIAANTNFFLPAWACGFLAPFLLRPGKRFFTPET
jgi:methionyl-tRNA formyltransferase